MATYQPQPRPHGRQPGLAGALRCTRCGSSVALAASDLELARVALVADLGFEPDRGFLELKGCCAECRSGARRGWGRA
jgi:Fe2+ or Zn2+ uptake regulation protein